MFLLKRPGVPVLICLVVLAITLCVSVRSSRADDDVTLLAPSDTESCLGCHSEQVDGTHFASSAHGRFACQLCHAGIDRFPHPEAALAKKPACVTCHAGKVADVTHSAHGKALAKKGTKANCQACHGGNPHEMAPAAKLPKSADFCARCHKDEAQRLGKSVHAAHRGKGTPDCATCHGGDPHTLQSPTAATHVVGDNTCWQCHTEQAKMLTGSAHGPAEGGKKNHLSCMSCHGGNPHGVATPVRASAPHADAACQKCHQDIAKRLASSAHGHAGPKTGKQIGCFACHGTQPHAIGHAKKLTETERSAMCERCHADQTTHLVSGAHGPGRVKNGRHLNCLSCHGHDQHAVTPPAAVAPLAKETSCKACHVGAVKTLAHSVHGRTGAKTDAKKPTCVDCHPSNPKLISTDPGKTRKQVEAACITCHKELAVSPKDDVHARPDKVPGDHPTCVACHGGIGHAITSPASMTPKQKVEVCAKCHRDEARMARYKIMPDTVPAYENTIHGKGVMRLGRTHEATCIDCHGLHGIVATHDPKSPTNPRNLPKICAKCHEGNAKDFAFSYASHYRFEIEKSVVIPMSRVFSQILVVGAIIALLSLVVLGYRQRLCNIGDIHTAGRMLDGYNALSLMTLFIAVTILLTVVIMARVGMPDVRQHVWAAVGLLALSLIAQFLKRVLPPCGPPPTQGDAKK
jgi:hypothetical protein